MVMPVVILSHKLSEIKKLFVQTNSYTICSDDVLIFAMCLFDVSLSILLYIYFNPYFDEKEIAILRLFVQFIPFT